MTRKWLAALKGIDWSMIGILASIFLIWQIGLSFHWDKKAWLLLLVCLIGVRKYANKQMSPYFFAVVVPTLVVFYFVSKSGPGFWWGIADSLFKNSKHIWVWDDFMRSIPLNDAAWARFFHWDTLDYYMRWIYNLGFVLPLWLGIIYCVFSGRLADMFRFVLSGHIMQLPLILPFYNLILLREVWWVKGQPDLLLREFADENAKLVTVMNCFPSMHTSIAFAMMLLALRQKDPVFKWVMAVYCGSIIWSTLYLQIHWVLDLFAGMLFAYGVVKLADGIVYLVKEKLMPARVKQAWQAPQPKPELGAATTTV
ncbi:phosphatase PAP2 family protein [Paenibacillus turpanensis]|uniref:phosphatase PAP2 family protein n=1 Tax=Paenibacillus turpanensis TaxID=2689078 RepID=UPI001FB61EEC|nr:phosphatase PAP2 family protein [Paenibacillus turpanensis]